MAYQTLHLDGKAYVLVPKDDFSDLARIASNAAPKIPKPNKNGDRPAIETIRSIASQRIISDRKQFNLSQRELAKLAGIPVATLCRIETGKCKPQSNTLLKIGNALEKARKVQL